MKKLSTVVLLIFFAVNLNAQERTISGRLTSNEDGSPLPGISIAIKGTAIGTTTDVDGKYSISVPVGATLVFSFIGMQTREIVVTENNLTPAKPSSTPKLKASSRSVPASLYQDSTFVDTVGIATLSSKSLTYSPKIIGDYSKIRSVKRIGNTLFIRNDNRPDYRQGFGAQWTSSLMLEQINRLPSFQNNYSQGQNVAGEFQWSGADQSQIFSWGPLARTLEYDGTPYPYDKNGRLTIAGTGNGRSAKTYNPSNFFRTGITSVNEIILSLPTARNGSLTVDVENRNRSGIIPNSNYHRLNASATLKNFHIIEKIKLQASLLFNSSEGDLLNRGGNLASIVGSVYRTPSTFDNANGLSRSVAKSSSEAYRLSDLSVRSHAPGLIDNPYGLVNELPDNERLKRINANVNFHYKPLTDLSFALTSNIDQQQVWNSFGIPPDYAGFLSGRITNRNEGQTTVNAIFTSSYRENSYNGIEANVSYAVKSTRQELERKDGFNFEANEFPNFAAADSLLIDNRSLTRVSHEVALNVHYMHDDWLVLKFNNRNYFSNTLKSDQYTNLFPSASVSIDFNRKLYLDRFDYLKLYTSISRTLREAPLIYGSWAYGSLDLPVNKYNAFYESSELFFNEEINPEIESKFETGLKLRTYSDLSLEVAYFNNTTNDFFVPVKNTENKYEIQNVAKIRNSGWNISIGFSKNYYPTRLGTDLRWSTYNSIVKELYSAQPWIPLAGFENSQSVLAVDQPVGAIYATKYARDVNGRILIGEDGFPIEDQQLSMVGNPIPDWTLGWSGYVQRKAFRFSFLFDFRKGGDIWNGTNAVLDYLGKSSATGKERSISNYIFDGVDSDGNINTLPVSFADPSQPLTANRWVRYGWDGVGENYIEDGSWIRLNELSCSYTVTLDQNILHVKDVRFSIAARNLFVITPYSGVDPNTTLFGSNMGTGLDLFNTPATRGYTVQITLKM
jgi:hypothetical protein